MEIITNAPGVPAPIGPYSRAVKAGGLVFCSGQIALSETSTMQLVSEDVEGQTRQVLENLRALLVASGSSWEKVVMTTIFLTDIAHGKVVNELYGQYVSKDAPPARQTVAVKALPMGALVEISVIAEAA